jgi:hypothetical protein
VGINTDTPKTTLDIVQKDQTVPGQGFRLDDGNQGNGKFLISDANGIGTWKNPDQCVTYTGAMAEAFFENNTGQVLGIPGANKWQIVPGSVSIQWCGRQVMLNMSVKRIGTDTTFIDGAGNFSDEVIAFLLKPELRPLLPRTPLSISFISHISVDYYDTNGTLFYNHNYNGFVFGSLINYAGVNKTAVYIQGLTT